VLTRPVAGRVWGLFVDFLVTKHGLAAALRSDQALHAYFLDRLVPACAEMLHAAAAAGEIHPGTDAYGLLRAVAGLRQPETTAGFPERTARRAADDWQVLSSAALIFDQSWVFRLSLM
jgi:hypothetical protein